MEKGLGPRSALTPQNLRKMKKCANKTGQSNRVVAKRLGFSKSSSSRGFLHELGLPAYRRPKQSKLTEKHIKMRYECSKVWKDAPIETWEEFIVTDEKIWTTTGYMNPQNDRVRAEKAEDVEPYNLDKFPGNRMSWMRVTPRGTTGLKWMKGNVNGENYRVNILEKTMLNDVFKRKGTTGPIHKRKLVPSNARAIFEEDFAKPHSSNANQAYMEEHFPNHTPTLHRYRGKHKYWFPPKLDDFWDIERVWAIMSEDVYREPRPTTIKAVMRRVREASLNLKPETLIKFRHQFPAKMNEIYRLKGKKIHSSFDPRKSPFACKCNVCAS